MMRRVAERVRDQRGETSSRLTEEAETKLETKQEVGIKQNNENILKEKKTLETRGGTNVRLYSISSRDVSQSKQGLWRTIRSKEGRIAARTCFLIRVNSGMHMRKPTDVDDEGNIKRLKGGKV